MGIYIIMIIFIKLKVDNISYLFLLNNVIDYMC